MAYSQVTNRSTGEKIPAADVNQLQDNIEAIKGGDGATAPTDTLENVISDSGLVKASDTDTDPGSLTDKIRAGSNITLSLTTSGTGGEQELEIASSGGGKPDFLIDLPADSMYVPTGALAPAPSSNDVGSNVEDMPVCLCDGSTDEGREYVFRVPEDPDTSGSITVEWIAYSGAASPSGTLAFSIRFVPIADDGTESWDQAYGTTQTATAVTMDNQDRIETISKTFTYAAVGFTAGDLVKLQTWRDVSEDTMATDASWVHFRLRMPRT